MNAEQSRYQAVRAHSEAICKPLQTEDYVAQPVQDVSPPKWHLAHTSWFFETFMLKPYLKQYKEYDKQYAFLFNSYYVGAGERMLRPSRGNMTRPTVEDIYKYRAYVDEYMYILLTEQLSITQQEVLEIGLNHEQQHQELLHYDIKYILGHNPLFPIYSPDFKEYEKESHHLAFIEVPKGNYGMGHMGGGFSFDNEHGQHQVYLEGAAISNRLVTNGEYLAFMNDKGYAKHDFWHSDGSAWLDETRINAPMYWHKIEGEWYHYTMQGLQAVDEHAPLMHISYYEAFAFAEWSGMRLPTEFEWENAADKLQWGARWEHTASAYLPYPRYQKPSGALGEYNGKFMVNQMVLRGASLATSPQHSRKTYRNFFHPHLQWQFNGIRLAKDL
ncbi:MAG: ergothioneine biosynthesis protein EgtB [Marivirga sp.]|jgi:ergothioneine biosynthesis protein EgtB